MLDANTTKCRSFYHSFLLEQQNINLWAVVRLESLRASHHVLKLPFKVLWTTIAQHHCKCPQLGTWHHHKRPHLKLDTCHRSKVLRVLKTKLLVCQNWHYCPCLNWCNLAASLNAIVLAASLTGSCKSKLVLVKSRQSSAILNYTLVSFQNCKWTELSSRSFEISSGMRSAHWDGANLISNWLLSCTYELFGKWANNCNRFVYNLILFRPARIKYPRTGESVFLASGTEKIGLAKYRFLDK